MRGKGTNSHAIYVDVRKGPDSGCNQWFSSRGSLIELTSEGDIITPEGSKVWVDEIVQAKSMQIDEFTLSRKLYAISYAVAWDAISK